MSKTSCTQLLRLMSWRNVTVSSDGSAYWTACAGSWALAVAVSANATRMDRQLFFRNDVAWRRLDRFIGVLSPGSYGCGCIASAGHPSETRRLQAPLPSGYHAVLALLPGFPRKCV